MSTSIAVIGGAGGIGSAICQRFVNSGYRVIVGDINRNAGESLKSALGDSCTFYYVDVRDENSIREFRELILNSTQSLEHVVSLAGGALPGEFEPLQTLAPSLISNSIDLNLKSHLLLTQGLLDLLKRTETPNKSITIISSINALRAFGLPAYSAAKAGLGGFIRSTCKELGAQGIRINGILAGTTPTPRTLKQPKDFNALRAGTVLNRLCTPDEIANVVYAVVDLMTCVTGQEIIADCGQTIKV